MICYKDMTFCGFKDCIHFNNGCPRSLTEEVKQGAINSELLICEFIDKPDCHEYPKHFTQNGSAHVEPDYKSDESN